MLQFTDPSAHRTRFKQPQPLRVSWRRIALIEDVTPVESQRKYHRARDSLRERALSKSEATEL